MFIFHYIGLTGLLIAAGFSIYGVSHFFEIHKNTKFEIFCSRHIGITSVVFILVFFCAGLFSFEYFPSSEALDEAYEKGYSDGGYDDGYDRGYDDAYDDGYDRGFDDGYDDGYDSGYDSGCTDMYDEFYSMGAGEKHLIELYRELNEEGQALVVDYTDTLVASGKYIKSDPAELGKATGA